LKVALDTNVLAYAEGVNGPNRQREAIALLQRLPADEAVVPVQVFGELFNVLIRRGGRTRHAARDALMIWRDAFPNVVQTSPETMTLAIELAKDHNLGIWDAVILAAASLAGARLLLSEDMQEGFTWGGVTIANPFRESLHPLLDAVLTPL
jgi:predicted nucleic acid-binding protein